MVSVRDGDLVLPFAAPMLARVLAVTGLPTDRALVVAEQVGAVLVETGRGEVDLDDVRRTTAGVLESSDEHETLRRLRVRWWIRGHRHPLVLTVGGTSGVGKSTVSQAVAEVLGIEVVLSTDLVRAVLRGTLHPDLVPALSGSSFSAEKMFRSNLAGNPLLAAFEQQALVGEATVPLLRRAIKEGMQVVLNGVHLVPNLVDIPPDWPVFRYVLTVPDLDEHERRFGARFATSDRDPQRYLDRIRAIRELDAHIVSQSRAAGIPVIESRALSQTVADTVGAVCTDLERAFSITPSRP